MKVSISGAKRLAGGSRVESKSETKRRARSAQWAEDLIFAKLTSKQRGELAEMMFMVKAAQKGFATAKPYGDSRRYDFVLDVGRRLWSLTMRRRLILWWDT